MRKFFVALVIPAAGCSAPLPPQIERTEVEEDVIAAAEAGWAEACLPDPGACLTYVRIRWVPEADVKTICQNDNASQCWLAFGATVILPDTRGPDAAVHELMHVMYACAVFDKKSPNPYGCRTDDYPDIFDYCHNDGRVWRDYPVDSPGGEGSAQYRAESILRELQQQQLDGDGAGDSGTTE